MARPGSIVIIGTLSLFRGECALIGRNLWQKRWQGWRTFSATCLRFRVLNEIGESGNFDANDECTSWHIIVYL